MTSKTDEKERAKQIILEIVRQAGGAFSKKTNLYKAFYYAHLQFAQTQPGYLSAWPIVRMPHGPGIDNFDVLLGELMAEGILETKQIAFGDYSGFKFMLCGRAAHNPSALPHEAIEAIAFGVSCVDGKSATQASDDSHVDSRAWRNASNGEELNIYLDPLSEQEYQDYLNNADKIGRQIDSIWG